MAILEESLASREYLLPRAVLEEVRKLGLRTAADGVAMIRRDRRAH
jgi:hypothetical protein